MKVVIKDQAQTDGQTGQTDSQTAKPSQRTTCTIFSPPLTPLTDPHQSTHVTVALALERGQAGSRERSRSNVTVQQRCRSADPSITPSQFSLVCVRNMRAQFLRSAQLHACMQACNWLERCVENLHHHMLSMNSLVQVIMYW